ncbi:MAG: DUF6518 family protein [Actinobacteria bacterium]|nr:DUF6518 family protein [Actinomycetota bacterium]
MSSRKRVFLVVAAAFAFGLVAAWAKGQNTDAESAISHARAIIGNLSTPWLVLAFVAGAQSRRVFRGALLGLATTMVALAGFYVLTTMVINLTAHGWIDELRREFMANRVYFQGGLLSGPLFGALGAWWNARRTLEKSFVVGVLLVGEPLVLAGIGMVFPGGVLTSVHIPGLIRVIPGWSFSQTTDVVTIAIYSIEFATGVALLVYALWRHRRTLRLDTV